MVTAVTRPAAAAAVAPLLLRSDSEQPRPITWSAGDGFSVTVVRTPAATAPVWGIASPGSELISSAVTHGTVPTVSGSLITVTAVTETPLTAGTQYRVTISRLNGDTGFIEFTP